MKTILVSGASGVVGYGILRSLRKSGQSLRLIGTTIYIDSVAEAFCDIFEKAPLTSDNNYLPWLLNTIDKYSIDLIIPGIEADLYEWVKFLPEIQLRGAKIVVNNLSLIELCKDKWEFYKHLSSLGSPYIIPTSLIGNFEVHAQEFGVPFLLKPKRGFGSKGIVIVHNQQQYDSIQGQEHLYIAQKLVGTDDAEFTTSAFGDGHGSLFCSCTLKRKLSKDGFTEKAEVVNIIEIEEAIRNLSQQFSPEGPTNFQFRMEKDVPKLLEINPRISSSTSIRTSFGYNESAYSVDYYLKDLKPDQPVIKNGKAIRYIEDYIFYL